MHTTPLVIRPVCADDVPAVVRLATLLDTMNLPRDPEMIASIVAESTASFARLTDSLLQPGVLPARGTYMLVAMQGEHVLGTASLLSHHGTPADPHYYLRVVEQTFRSTQLQTERHRHLLRLQHDDIPWTELGGLVVHPEARGHGLGKLLLAARLLLVAMYPAHFCQRLIAELLPPRRADGSNAFWDALGAPLTGLHYYRADLLCRTDKEFIESLFPSHEIVLELLPPEAQAVVAQVGPATVPVCHLLQRAGFQYLGTVDPFDGGPHYGATREEVSPLQRSRSLVCLDFPPTASGHPLLLANPQCQVFHATAAQVCGHGLRLEETPARLLALQPGDVVWSMPLDW